MSGQPHPTAALRLTVDTLAQALAQWATRDDTKAQPEVRQAANDAMDAIDAMLRELHTVRAALATEMRQSDDTAMARAGALLARVRHEFPDGQR